MGQKTPAAHLPLLPWSGWVGAKGGGGGVRERVPVVSCNVEETGGGP